MSEKTRMTRRQFFKETAVIVGAGAAGAAMLDSLAPAPAQAALVPKKWDQEAEVIVVGSGPTGLPAAIAAAEKGASVIVLEQGTQVGGCGVIAGGILDIGGGTRIQKLNDIPDTPELLFQRRSNYKDRNQKRNDPALLRAWCNANPGTFDWLEQRGVRFMNALSAPGGSGALHTSIYHYIIVDQEGPGAAFFKSAEGITGGAGLIRPLETYARGKGVKILLEHKMTGIIRKPGKGGRVLGVEVQAGKKKVTFRAKKAVILGTGGWKGNRFLRKLFDPRITEEILATGEPFVNPDGSGIVAGLEAGAAMATDHAVDSALYRRKFGTKHYNFPLNSPYGAPGLEMHGARMADLIIINKAGKRFVSEQDIGSFGPFSYFDACLAQEGHVLWVVFDDAAAKKYKWDIKPPVTEKDCAFAAPTPADLAKLINVPADALSETIRKYNTYVDEGKDSEFDRPKNLLKAKLETPPFYAVWMSIFVHDTCGGLAVNAKSQVLDIYGKVIPGLYAGGEAAGGLDAIGMPRGIIMGRIAGENAAAEAA